MNIHETNWISSKPAVKIVMICASVLAVGILVVGLLWAAFFEPNVPDPKTAEVREAVEFMKTDTFRKLDTARRNKYYEDVADRFHSMSHQERLEAGQNLRGLKLSRRDREAVGIKILQGYVDEYMEKSPQERRVYMNSVQQMVERVAGRSKLENDYYRVKTDSEFRKKRIAGGIKQLPRGLRTTSARDRAKMAHTMRDWMATMHNRYENP